VASYWIASIRVSEIVERVFVVDCTPVALLHVVERWSVVTLATCHAPRTVLRVGVHVKTVVTTADVLGIVVDHVNRVGNLVSGSVITINVPNCVTCRVTDRAVTGLAPNSYRVVTLASECVEKNVHQNVVCAIVKK